jgi:dTDP-4-amino-4,6-dideoxygalactose transaminase
VLKVRLNNPFKPKLEEVTKQLERINDNSWFTNFGPVHEQFKFELESYLGVENLLLVNNGTTALQVAGRALGCRSYLTTPFSFVATASAYLWQGDTLQFSDIDESSLNLSMDKLNVSYNEFDAILATHVYGNPCNLQRIQSIADKLNKKVIYDAAHAFGVKVDGKPIVNFGDASVLSFHATKVFHSIEGGAIVFKDTNDYQKAKELINFGIDPDVGITDTGINGKMSEYHAAVGLVNLKYADQILEHRSKLFSHYRNNLKDIVELPLWHSSASCNGAYMPILLKDYAELVVVKEALYRNGIESRQYFSPSLDNIFLKNNTCPVSNNVASRTLCLPLHYYMSINDIDYIVSVARKSIKGF